MGKINNIILVDDHEIFRKGLIMILKRLKNAKVVAETGSGEEFLELIQHQKADIVFMDIEMPGMNGIEATIKALEIQPTLKIIALSMFADDEYIQSMLDAGAKGFLIKNINRSGLQKAIDMIAAGKNYYSDELWTFFTRKVATDDSIEEIKDKCTKREFEVLQLICEGLTNEEIAEKLFISQRTVVNHKSSLISKTKCKNTVQLVTFAIRNKLVEI